MDENDIQNIIKALDNEENENIMKLTSDKIKNIKLNILKDLNLSKTKLNEIIEKLEDYIYIDEIPDIKYGSYLRWIPLKDFNNIKLTNGAIICDIIV